MLCRRSMLLLRSAVAGAGSLAALAAARCDAADTRSRPATEAEIAEAKALFAASQQRSTAPTANCMFASNQDMATLLSLTSRSLVDARGRPVDGATLKNKARRPSVRLPTPKHPPGTHTVVVLRACVRWRSASDAACRRRAFVAHRRPPLAAFIAPPLGRGSARAPPPRAPRGGT